MKFDANSRCVSPWNRTAFEADSAHWSEENCREFEFLKIYNEKYFLYSITTKTIQVLDISKRCTL